MKKILVIKDSKDYALNKERFTDESELQGYLRKYPDLIPLEEVMDNAPRLLCIGEEVELPSGFIDLLFIDEDGTLTIVETKLARNPEIRRKVIGQVVEYASHLSNWTVDEVYAHARDFLGRQLEEIMEEIWSDFSSESFRVNVVDKLKKGEIRLVIAVDEIVETLRTTVTFLNRNSKFDILLLEVTSFNDVENRKILVPSIFGYATKEVATVSPTIDKLTFLSLCQHGGHRRAIELCNKIENLLERRRGNGDYLRWGISGYSYRMPRKGYSTPEAPFVCNTNGDVIIRLSIIDRSGKAGQIYLERLTSIASIANNIGDYREQSEKMFSTDYMMTKDIDVFVSAIEQLGLAFDEE